MVELTSWFLTHGPKLAKSFRCLKILEYKDPQKDRRVKKMTFGDEGSQCLSIDSVMNL